MAVTQVVEQQQLLIIIANVVGNLRITMFGFIIVINIKLHNLCDCISTILVRWLANFRPGRANLCNVNEVPHIHQGMQIYT